jgi:hypothetical protein
MTARRSGGSAFKPCSASPRAACKGGSEVSSERLKRSTPSVRVITSSTMLGLDVAPVAPRLKQSLAHGKQSDDEDDNIDAVEQLRDTERQPRLAGR